MLNFMPRLFMKMRERDDLLERNRSLFDLLDNSMIRSMRTRPRDSAVDQDKQVDFYILNYSMASFRAKYRDGMHMDKVRINFAPHAYMFDGCQPGDTR